MDSIVILGRNILDKYIMCFKCGVPFRDSHTVRELLFRGNSTFKKVKNSPVLGTDLTDGFYHYTQYE